MSVNPNRRTHHITVSDGWFELGGYEHSFSPSSIYGMTQWMDGIGLDDVMIFSHDGETTIVVLDRAWPVQIAGPLFSQPGLHVYGSVEEGMSRLSELGYADLADSPRWEEYLQQARSV